MHLETRISPGKNHALSHECLVTAAKRAHIAREAITAPEDLRPSSDGAVPPRAHAPAVKPHGAVGGRSGPFADDGEEVGCGVGGEGGDEAAGVLTVGESVG